MGLLLREGRGKKGRRRGGKLKGKRSEMEGRYVAPLKLESLDPAVEEGRKGEGQEEELWWGVYRHVFFHFKHCTVLHSWSAGELT